MANFASLKHLLSLNHFFWKYRWRCSLGVLFVVISNYFGILSPQITGFVIDKVTQRIQEMAGNSSTKIAPIKADNDPLVHWFTQKIDFFNLPFEKMILYTGIILLILALLRGFFMFLMRQTLIVMSRHIEYDQKNQVYDHYQRLDAQFFKIHSTGDLMNRITEDVSRVRMYTGPAIMYLVNLIVLISLSLYYMISKDWRLSLYTLAPLPILAYTIYWVNTIINKRSEQIQERLSDLTINAQESFSGIRVIKSYVQEDSMFKFFSANSESYRQNAIGLAKVEALYFPSIGLLIGISTLITIMVGGMYQMNHQVSPGTIAEFVVYINMLTFPVSAVGWVASMVQRASASQKRLNEFLNTQPDITSPKNALHPNIKGQIRLENVSFTYEHTGIQAIQNINLEIQPGEKIAIVGRTGSGKTTLAQLLLRFFDPQTGNIKIDGLDLRSLDLYGLRDQVAYISQEVFLFSETVANNIRFGKNVSQEELKRAAQYASVEEDILRLPNQFETMVGERGVTLSGGQKQRVAIARALAKDSQVMILDDCLSAVDAKTEKQILASLTKVLAGKTAIIITHRIFSLLKFDKIIVMEEGKIVEQGTHEELLALNGYYSDMFNRQLRTEEDQ